jgi:hypothetical protein
MRLLARCLMLALIGCVAGAGYLSLREIALPDASVIDPTLKESEPLQQVSVRPAFTTIIEEYTYTLTPRATYDIAGLVVSQHHGDALFNLYHTVDPGNIKDVCIV